MIVRELLARLGFKVDTAAVSRWERRVESAKRAMVAAKKAAKAFAQAVKKLALGAGVAAGAMLSLVKKVADVGDQAAKDARKLGMTAESMQELSHAAKLSGSEVGTMKVGLQALARGLNDATTKGTGPAAEAFEQLGLSLDDPAVKSNDLNQVMELVADRFEHMPDGAKKTALAMKLFSRSGAELIPLLNSGSRGIAQMRREARELGLVMSNEAAAESERFNDDLERTKGQLFGVAATISTNLMPTIRQWMESLREWIGENKVLIEQKVRDFVMGVVEAGQELAPVIVSAVEAVGDLVDMLGGADKALYAAVAGMAAMKLATIAATNPWLALAAAITAAGMALGDYLGKNRAHILHEGGVGAAYDVAQSKAIQAGEKERDEIKKKFAKKAADKVKGFAPELVEKDGTPNTEAFRINEEINKEIDAQVDKRLRKADPGKEGDVESFARRELEARKLAARHEASKILLTGGSFEDASRAARAGISRSGRKSRGRGRGRGRGKRPNKDTELKTSGSEALSVDEMLERDFGSGVASSAAGTKVRPSLGTTINKITNEYKPQVTQQYTVVQRGGEASEAFAQRIGAVVDEKIGQVFNRGYQHFKGATSA